MNHLNEEQLILHYYGESNESPEAEQHLDECAECRALYASMQRVLNVVDSLPVPERTADYGAQVWSRLEQSGSIGRRPWVWQAGWRWAAALAFCSALAVVAFNLGRFYPQAPRKIEIAAGDAGSRDRILRLAVGDYLERSQRLLSDLANADPDKPLDISMEQDRISDLLMESRLYRQTASVTGERAIGAVLEDLERVLVDLSHERPELSPQDVGYLHDRLEGGGILFKVRVLGDNVRSGDGISKGRTL